MPEWSKQYALGSISDLQELRAAVLLTASAISRPFDTSFVLQQRPRLQNPLPTAGCFGA